MLSYPVPSILLMDNLHFVCRSADSLKTIVSIKSIDARPNAPNYILARVPVTSERVVALLLAHSLRTTTYVAVSTLSYNSWIPQMLIDWRGIFTYSISIHWLNYRNGFILYASYLLPTRVQVIVCTYKII